MRVTTTVLMNQAMIAMRGVMSRLGRSQQQLATGRRIQSPADDPAGHAAATRLAARVAAAEQYRRQADQARARLADSADLLQNLQPLLGRTEELAVSAADASKGPAERAAIATEVNEILEELVSRANTTSDGRYLLGGLETLTAPLAVTRDAQGRIAGATWNPHGVDGVVDIAIGPGVTVQANVGGTTAFGADSDPDFLPRLLVELRDALLADDPDAVRALLSRFQVAEGRLAEATAQLGSRLRVVEQAQDGLGNDVLAARDALFTVMDADMARVASDLAQQEIAYQAALHATARAIQPSLLEFLR